MRFANPNIIPWNTNRMTEIVLLRQHVNASEVTTTGFIRRILPFVHE